MPRPAWSACSERAGQYGQAVRLADIRSKKQSSTCLPQYSQAHSTRIAVPLCKEPDSHRPLQHRLEQLARICALLL
jgi:hypothetical protein